MKPLVGAALALALAGCSTIHGDDLDGAISKTGQGFGALLGAMGSELKTRVWRSEPSAPAPVPAAHTAPAPRQ